MKFLFLMLIAALLCTACGTETPVETEAVGETEEFWMDQLSDESLDSLMNQISLDNQYSIFWQLRAEVNDDAHNAKADIPYVTFPKNAEITEKVNESLFLPLIQEYNTYVDSPADPVQHLTIDACVYESEEYLSMTCMSTLDATAPVTPDVIGVVVDLKTEEILTPEALLARYDRSAEDVLADAGTLFAEKYPEITSVTIDGVVTAFFDAQGDRIVVLSYTDAEADLSEGVYFYNDTDNTLCTQTTETRTFDSIAY